MTSSTGSLNTIVGQVQNPFKQPFYGSIPSQRGVDAEDDDNVDGMEMAPSDTSSQHNGNNLINEEAEL